VTESEGDFKGRGFVNSYDVFKGFGFIRRKEGRDVFFFYSDITGDAQDLSVGDVVEFDIENARKGPRARNLRKVGGD